MGLAHKKLQTPTPYMPLMDRWGMGNNLHLLEPKCHDCNPLLK